MFRFLLKVGVGDTLLDLILLNIPDMVSDLHFKSDYRVEKIIKKNINKYEMKKMP